MKKGLQRRILLAAVLFPALPEASLAAQPSFDCSKASGPDEVAICTNDTLATLDNIANAGYIYLRAKLGGRKANQIDIPFIRTRQRCGADEKCILDTQIAAIELFRSLGAPITVPGGVREAFLTTQEAAALQSQKSAVAAAGQSAETAKPGENAALKRKDAAAGNAAIQRPAASQPSAASSAQENQEQVFVDIVVTARNQYRSGENEMQQGAARPARAKQLCSLLKDFTFSNWTGKVDTVSSNNAGKGVFAVTVANDISLKTWNNSFSDTFDKTLIEPDDPVFAQASRTHKGQTVRVSGTFVPSDVDCIKEASLTLNGSMTAPEFIVKFTQIEVTP